MVAVLEVVGTDVVVVGVLVIVGVVVDVVVDGVLVVDVVVEVEVVVASCWRHSVAASSAIVEAPWPKLRRSVGLTVTGRCRTSLLRAALALIAAPQSPD